MTDAMHPSDPGHSDASGGVNPNLEQKMADVVNEHGDAEAPAHGQEIPTADPSAIGQRGPLPTGAELANMKARLALHERVENDFRYHPPRGPSDTVVYEAIRSQARRFAHELVELIPPGRELSRALSDLEDCVMHANAGYARSESGK